MQDETAALLRPLIRLTKVRTSMVPASLAPYLKIVVVARVSFHWVFRFFGAGPEEK
jgi:hypothetical protein